MVKKEVVFIVVTVLGIVLFSQFSSAGVFDWFKQVTGRATSDSLNLSITVGNNVPNITFVTGLHESPDPSANTVAYFNFNFTAYDADGAVNLNDSSASAYFQRSGETTRSNTSCQLIEDFATNYANYTCQVGMWYFDAGAVSWTINVTIDDINGARGENSTTSFTYNEGTADMSMSPSALTWATLALSDTDTGSTNDPLVINNTMNSAISVLNLTAIDLEGETSSGFYIYAGNFSVNVTDVAQGSTMVNGTTTEVAGSFLPIGNHSINNGTEGQEELYFYINAINPDLPSQTYSTTAGGSWTLSIA